MQALATRFETAYADSVAEPMDKRGEISAAKPNAATRADVERVKKRIEALGLSFHDAVEKAQLSRPTGFRLLKGEGSVASLRQLDEYAAREEARQKRTAPQTAEQQDAALEEWAQLGRELQAMDPERFASTLDGLRDVLESVKLQRAAFSKMFRATPDPRR